MERKITLKYILLSGLMLTGICFTCFAKAETIVTPREKSIQTERSVAKTTTTDTANKSTNDSQPAGATRNSKPEESAQMFPNLERALVIATIVNLLVIVFGLAIYLVKRRMQQFSPVGLARVDQSGNR